MRVIKLAIISAVFFFLLITGFSLFIPSHIRISKAIDINAGKDVVMMQVSDAANWKKWYPGADSMNSIVANGKIKGIETKSRQGLMITAVNDSTVLAAHVGTNSKGGEIGWNFYPVNNNVTVQWYMDFHLRWYPWEKFGSLILEGSYGPDMEKGLSNLRRLLEN